MIPPINENSECDISFFPKKVSSDLLLVEDSGQNKTAWTCFRKNEILTAELLNSYIVDILKYCLTHRVDSYRIHLDRLKGAKLIKKVARRTNYNDLALTQIVGLIWSSISVLHHFHIRILHTSGYKAWVRKRQYHYALQAYEEVLLMLLPQLFTTVIQSLITFFHESKIWELESLISVLLRKMLDVCKDNEAVVNNLLELVSCSETSDESQNVLKVLHNILDYIQWYEMDDFLITRMLEMYRQYAIEIQNPMLTSGLEACLRHALRRMQRKDILKAIKIMLEWPSIDEGSIIEFGNILEYASMLNNNTESYITSIGDDIFPILLDLVSSDNVFVSLLAVRVLFFMLERNNNSTILLTPRIFFQDVEVSVSRGIFKVEDKRFLQNYHQLLFTKLMDSVMKHGTKKVNLECTFAIIAAITVEVPCGYTAAASVCFAMAMQEYALSSSADLEVYNVYQIHACVMFIMSLVCYVHKAKVFYDYVNSVLSRRAQLAPQLNPPLCSKYRDRTVHLKKPELYFEDWEARYGLWKCFISSTIGNA